MLYFDVYSPTLGQVLADDVPPIVREAWTSPSTRNSDDILMRTRPNTDYVINRDYRRYEPKWSWSDFMQPERVTVPVRSSYASYKEGLRPRPYLYSETDPSLYRGRYSARSSSTLPDYTPSYRRETPSYKTSGWAEIPERHINSEFPFRKYRSDFIPYSPYPNLYSNVKYSPNPDWSLKGNWGHKYRKQRFIYDLTEQDSSRSREIERVMREARLRELCKGVYSSTYSNTIQSKVLQSEPDNEKITTSRPKRDYIDSGKSLEAETAPSESERQRRSLTLAEKRRRNETLAVGLTSQELLKKPIEKEEEKDTAVKFEDTVTVIETAPVVEVKDTVPEPAVKSQEEYKDPEPEEICETVEGGVANVDTPTVEQTDINGDTEEKPAETEVTETVEQSDIPDETAKDEVTEEAPEEPASQCEEDVVEAPSQPTIEIPIEIISSEPVEKEIETVEQSDEPTVESEAKDQGEVIEPVPELANETDNSSVEVIGTVENVEENISAKPSDEVETVGTIEDVAEVNNASEVVVEEVEESGSDAAAAVAEAVGSDEAAATGSDEAAATGSDAAPPTKLITIEVTSMVYTEVEEEEDPVNRGVEAAVTVVEASNLEFSEEKTSVEQE